MCITAQLHINLLAISCLHVCTLFVCCVLRRYANAINNAWLINGNPPPKHHGYAVRPCIHTAPPWNLFHLHVYLFVCWFGCVKTIRLVSCLRTQVVIDDRCERLYDIVTGHLPAGHLPPKSSIASVPKRNPTRVQTSAMRDFREADVRGQMSYTLVRHNGVRNGKAQCTEKPR